jgi:hypothetical protein
VNPPEGEGFISFALYPAEGIAHDTEIRNYADIIFDLNEIIRTGTWVNTIDIEPPVTLVSPLDEVINDTVIHLQWQGSDPHAGIRGYDVYAAVNDSAFRLIAQNIQQEELTLYGEYGISYGFYVTATDHTGNQELKTALAETTTSLKALDLSAGDATVEPSLSLYPVPANDILTLEIRDPGSPENTIEILDPTGRVLQRKKRITETNPSFIELDVSGYSEGIYFIRVIDQAGERSTMPLLVVRMRP